MIVCLIFYTPCTRDARTHNFYNAHFSDKHIFFSATIFSSLQKCDIASFDARKIYFRLPVISSQARRVKILRNFCVKKSRKYLARHGEKNSRVLWQRCGMASRSIQLYLRLVSTWRGRAAVIVTGKTGSPLDLIGFDISCRWGSSRRRLAIILYPVTRRAIRSQLNEAPPFFLSFFRLVHARDAR